MPPPAVKRLFAARIAQVVLQNLLVNSSWVVLVAKQKARTVPALKVGVVFIRLAAATLVRGVEAAHLKQVVTGGAYAQADIDIF